MPIQYINTGSSANAGNGDSIRLAFDKVNRNFKLVDTSINDLSNGFLNSLHIATTASIHNLIVTGTTHLNTVESATFLNQTYFENITVSNTSTLNLVTANDAKIDTLEVLTSLSVGSYQIAAINDYNDFSIIKNDATGLAVVLLNTNADSNSKLVVKDNISGGLAILHQNLTNLAGDFVPGENYIYGETPTDVIHIGAYSDIKFSASQAKYYDPALPETPSMVIQSIDGAVHVYSSATFHSDVYGITGAGANAGTLDRLTSQDLSKVVTLSNNGSLIPSADLTYDLGSTSSQWRSLYVGTSTIYLGGTALSVAGGNITIDGNPIQAGAQTGSTSTLVNGAYTVSLGSDGSLTLPYGQSIGSDTLDGIKLTTDRGTVLFGNTPEQCVPTQSSHFHIMRDDPTTVDLFFGDDLNYVKLPYDSTLTNVGVQIGTDATNLWSFGKDGLLTLPSGNTRIGNVFGTDGIIGSTGTGVGVGAFGQGGYAALQWIDDPENIESTSTQVAAVVVNSPIASTTGTVQILTGLSSGPTADYIWEFGTDGTLAVPDDIQDANGSVVRVASTSTAPTRVDGQLWFDNQEGRLYIKNGGVWLDASPTQIPSPETYLDGLSIDGTVISTANVDGDAIVIDGGDNTKLTVSNNSVTIQVPGSGIIRPYWAAEFGGITTAITTSSYTVGTGAFYDSVGNVYVLGGVLFGGGLNDVDSLLLKYDTNGNLLWSRTWHDNSGGNCGAVNQAFAIDSNDRIYWLATNAISGGCWTGYMDTDGNLGLGGIAQGSLGFNNAGVSAVDIACDNSGNYYLAGSHYDSYQTPVVIKVDGNSGAPIWTGRIIPEDFEDLPADGQYRAVTVNPATGDVWAIGDYIDNSNLYAMLSKWDVNGVHQWTKKLVTASGDLASAVIYNGGYVYTIVNDDGSQEAIVSKFDTDGDLIWASYLAAGALDPIPDGGPGSSSTGAYDLSFDASGNVYVTGTIPGPPEGQPQLWITKLNPANGEMLYSRILITDAGVVVIDQGAFGGGSSGHRVGDIYQDKIAVTAVTSSDIDDSTGTNEIRVMVAQLPIDGSVTGTFGNITIGDLTSDIDSICSTGTYTVTTLVWSTGTSTAIYSTSSISVSYVTDIVGLTGETLALGSDATGSTATNTWTFVNNNIILPPGGDILDSNGVSVLGATSIIALPSWITVVPGTNHLPTLNTDYGWDSSGAWSTNATIGESNEGTSFPFRTTFSIPNDTKSVTTVDFIVNEIDESDFGIAVFASGNNPVWEWDGDGITISAKYTPTELSGISGNGGSVDWTPPSLGTYRARLTVEPTGPGTADIMLETLDTSNNILDTITYTETEFFGTDYKIGFASDNDGGVNKTYFKNLTINIGDGATVYTDTLMNGSSVGDSTTALGDRLTAGSSSVVLSSTGTLTLPQGGTISEVTVDDGIRDPSVGILLTPYADPGTNPDMAVKIYPTFNHDDHIHIVAGNPTTVDLFLGDDDQYVKLEQNHGNIVIGTNTTVTNSTWTFGTDGNLTLPEGGTITEGGGLTGAIRLTPAGGANANQALVIYPTAATPDGDHLHLTAGGGTTELYLGNDFHYVKLVDGGDVEIKATTASLSTSSSWTFGTDGVLTLSTASTILGNSSDPNVYIETATTSTTSTWTFAADGSLTLPAGGDIKNSSGTSVLTVVTGQETYEFDGVNTTLTITNVTFNLLFCTAAVGYSGSDGHTVLLPPGTAGQRLVIVNISSLCTLTVDGAIDGAVNVAPEGTAELIYLDGAGVTSWWPLYGTTLVT